MPNPVLEQISKVQHRRNMRGRSVGLVEKTRKDGTLNVLQRSRQQQFSSDEARNSKPINSS
jgi:hypothetical protein